MNGINALIAQGIKVKPIDFAGIQAAQLQNELRKLQLEKIKMEMGQMPEEQNWLRKSREMESEQFGWKRKKFEQEQEDKPFKDSQEALDFAEKWQDRITYENYPDSRETLLKRKAPKEWFPSREYFDNMAAEVSGGQPDPALAAEIFQIWKRGKFTTLKNKLSMGKLKMDEDFRERELKVKEQGISLKGRELDIKEKGKSDTSAFGKLLKEYNDAKTPEEKSFYKAKLIKETTSRGLKVKTNPDGTVEIIEGPMGEGADSGLGKLAQGKVEEKLLTSTDALRRLKSIEGTFKPEYQEYATRFGAMWGATKEKLGGKLNDKEKEDLKAITIHRRKTIANMNQYLNEMSGAAITPQEAERLSNALPNAGVGILDGDSPTQFQGKLEGVFQELRMAIARLNYIRKHGFGLGKVGLDQMPKIVNERAKEIKAKLKADTKGTDVSEADLNNQAKKILAEEFGLTSE